MAHAQTSKFTLYTLLLALFILVACGGAKPSLTAGGNGTPGPVDCSVRGNSFNAACRNEPAAVAARLELCSGTIADLTAAGGSRTACNTATFVDAICVSSGPDANPFAPICVSETTRTLELTLTIYEVQETYCTETNVFHERCTGALVECDDEDVCTNPVNVLRLTACTDYDGADATALMAAGGTVASCDSPLLAGVICGTATAIGTNPFAAICTDATGNSDSANIEDRQLAYCSENTEAGDCPMMISTFCATADGAKSQTLCPSQYAAATTAPLIVTAVVAKGNARNVADTAEATVLEEIEGGAYTSYVDAIAGTNKPTFNFGGAAHGVGGVSIIQDGLLLSELVFKESKDDTASEGLGQSAVRTLPNVANAEGTELANIGNTDGFAIARVDNPAFTSNPDGAFDTKARFYAGLLTTTDLGAPLTDRSADGIWTAEFVAIVSNSNSDGRSGRRIATRSTLRVSFADKTIQTREVADTYSPEVADPTDFYDGISTETNNAGRPYNIAGSRITIDGRFNVEGVIFGESSWIYDGKTSRGSVSGLIGLEGAVGAFVSNGQNNGVNSNGEYAGGFVASNECAIIPFHASCADRHFDGLRAARIGFCKDGTQSANPLCMQADVLMIMSTCTADPFASACSPYGKQYKTEQAERALACRGANHASVTCTSIMRSICNFDYDPFAPICVNNAPNQTSYCRLTNPFDKTNCISDEDDNVANQRTFCGGRNLVNAQTSPFYDECTRTIWSTCGLPDRPNGNGVNLFDNSLCGGNEYDAARGLACMTAGQVPSSITPAPNCGDETDSNSYVYAYCDSDAGLTNFRDCPVAYARKNPVVSTVSLADFTSTGKNQLLNPDRSGPLTVVASGGASLADANTNFITDGANRLDLGLANDKTVGTRTLKLNELGGNDNATSGFFIATGLIDNGGTDVIKKYVGLLSGTSLGAPLSDAMHGGTWGGKIRLRMGKINAATPVGNATLNLDFKLKVDFATKTLKIVNSQGADAVVSFTESDYEGKPVKITTSPFSPNRFTVISPTFSITNGKFTDNGVIYGTTNLLVFSRNTAGTLAGLIGRDGAVGIFASDGEHGLDWDYVGGFVATPTAPPPPPVATKDFTKWARSFTKSGVNASMASYPLQNSGFVNSKHYTANYIRLDDNNAITFKAPPINPSENAVNTLIDLTLPTTILRLSTDSGSQDYKSGVAYAYSDDYNQAYSGLLPTTDVGLPLSYLPQFAYWDGKIAGTLGGTDFSDNTFTLHVNYNAGSHAGTIRTVDVQNFDGRTYLSTTNIVAKFRRGNSINSINIKGDFDSNGVMFGTVAFNGVINNGTFNGLIGQKSAVGVFNGVVSAFVPYAGGFIVDNPNN